jgi:hypothetical protein
MPAKFPFHRLHRILPVMDLSEQAKVAFGGAKYHLERARALAPRDKRYDEFAPNSNQFYWELRAFFWEITASYEIILQWANQEFDLRFKGRKLADHKVTHEKIVDKETVAHRDTSRWEEVKKTLEDAGNSKWYFEMYAYRNFNIHRAFTLLQVAVIMPEPFNANAPIEEGSLLAIQINPAREGQERGDLFKHLDHYVEEMALLGRRIFEKTDC